jgi:hypothetical protein
MLNAPDPVASAITRQVVSVIRPHFRPPSLKPKPFNQSREARAL